MHLHGVSYCVVVQLLIYTEVFSKHCINEKCLSCTIVKCWRSGFLGHIPRGLTKYLRLLGRMITCLAEWLIIWTFDTLGCRSILNSATLAGLLPLVVDFLKKLVENVHLVNLTNNIATYFHPKTHIATKWKNIATNFKNLFK